MSGTVRCKKSSSLNKETSHRKTPKGIFHRTWSASTYRNQLEQQQQQQSIFNLTKASNYIVSTLPIETRIDFYEKKYQLVMASETNLSCWIQSTRENAAPLPLIKPPSAAVAAAPPPAPCTPTPTKSRLPDFLFSSLSTRPKKKNQAHTDLSPLLTPSPSSSPLPSPSPAPKSSISTFLRKATASYSKQSSKHLQVSPKTTPSTSQQDSNHRRFSLASSLNRLSLSRNSSSSIVHSEEPPNPTNNENTTNTTKSKYNRFSTPLLRNPAPLQKEKLTHSTTYSKELPRYSLQSQSSSSIFLERLGSRSPSSPKSSQQPNVLSKTNTHNSNSSIGSMDQDTPPASLSQTMDPRPQRSKRPSQQGLFFHHHATVKPSLTMMANMAENKILQEKSVSTNTHNKKCVPAAALPLNGGGYSVMNTTATQQVKKKRATILVTPSFSSIRLISQKSQFLKQSMLA